MNNEILFMIENFEQIYINSLNFNGIHNFTFIKNIKSSKIIKITDFIKIPLEEWKSYQFINHIGIKQEIKNNIWMVSLFTSQKFFELDGIIYNNLELTENIHKYINHPIIVDNNTFCEFFFISDSFNTLPKYCKDLIINLNNESIIIKIHEDCLTGYKKMLFNYNFNKPMVLYDKAFKFLKNKSIISWDQVTNNLVFEESKEFMNYLGITKNDIDLFIKCIFENTNIKGENLIKKESISSIYNSYIESKNNKFISIKKLKY